MLKKIKKYSSSGSRFRNNFLKVAAANIFSQAIPIIATPILTRLYFPEDFGVLALFMSVLSIMLVLSTLRIDWLISAVKKDFYASNIFIIGVTNLLLITTCVSMFFYLGLYSNLPFINWTLIESFLWLLPVAMIGGGLHQLLSSWLVREGDLTAVAIAKIKYSISGTGFSVAGGWLSLGALGLIFSASVSYWFGLRTLITRVKKNLGSKISRVSISTLLVAWKKVWGRIVVAGSTGIVNTFGLVLPSIMIAYYYTATELGWYALMYRLATSPVSAITNAISQSFMVEARRLYHDNPASLLKLFTKTSKRLLMLGAPVAIICLLGPLYIGPILGADLWDGAGYVLLSLSPLIWVIIVVSTLAPVIVIAGKENVLFIWDALRTMLIAFVFFYSGSKEIPFYYTLLAYSISVTIMYLFLYIINYYVLRSLVK